ncbi:MAG: membrane protein DedA with SNARE-associated domain [Candidatus Azotimanducaceae bacterium]|jgi:membrane protein DedA with SNARE-associated domain
MIDFLQFLIDHGYTVVFIWVALDQAGLPLPAIPLMLAAGALVGMGQLSLPLILLTCVIAAVPIDAFWFWLGRLRGTRVLHLLCILSLEPDFCVKDTQSLFRKLGPMSVVIAKFMPGLQTLAPPMSGLTGMNLWLFLALDTLGTLIWASIFLSFGYYFHTELELLAERIAEAGLIAGIVTVTLVTTYFSWKLVKRRQFLKNLQMRRMTPDEVKMRIQQGDDLKILDLRHDYDVNSIPHLLPGALRVPMESIELHHRRIPKDSDIVLYCS